MGLWRLSARRALVVASFWCLIPANLLLVPGRSLRAQAAEAAPAAGAAEALLKEGLTHFQERKYAEAAAAFEKAFALAPTQDQIARFLDATNLVLIMQMVRSDDMKMSGIGRQLLKDGRKIRHAHASDTERIKAQVDKVFAATEEQEKLTGMIRGASEFGRNLVPALLSKLGSPESADRTRAFLWVTKIENDAVPALVAAVHHPNALVRQNIARLLGARPIRDPYALGALQGMVETDTSPEVKQAAAESADAIRRDMDAVKPLSAKEYHLTRAELLYLRPHLNPFAGAEYAPTVYTLKGEELESEVVAPFQLSLRMAEAELVEALRLDPAFTKAKVQRLVNEVLEVVQYDDSVAAYKDNAEVQAILAAQKDMMDTVRRLRIKAQSPEVLFAGLRSALRDRRAEVAEKVIQIIDENRLRGAVPAELVQALKQGPSRLVRIAAAVALARWNPEDGDGGETVVGMLAEAAVSSGVRTVLKVMGNSDSASRFDALFRELNVESGGAIQDIPSAIQRAMDLPPDLVLIDEETRLERGPGQQARAPVNAFIVELRKAHRTQSTPIVVAMDPAKLLENKSLYESPERKVMVISLDADKTAFRTQVIDALFAESDDQKARATRLAAKAAEALAYLSSTNTRYSLAGAVGPLERVLTGRPDEVRIPALTALGNLGGGAAEALKPIAEVYANLENAVPVREAAMVALGRILAGGREAAPAEVLKTIRAGLAEADPRLRMASFVAFSTARASDVEQLAALTDEVKSPAPAAPAAPEKAAGKPAEGKGKPAEGEEPDAGAGEKAEKPEKDAPDAGGAGDSKEEK